MVISSESADRARGVCRGAMTMGLLLAFVNMLFDLDFNFVFDFGALGLFDLRLFDLRLLDLGLLDLGLLAFGLFVLELYISGLYDLEPLCLSVCSVWDFRSCCRSWTIDLTSR